MKFTIVIASVLTLSATAAMADGADCAAKYTSASATSQQSTASTAPNAMPAGTVIIAESNGSSGVLTTIRQ